MTRPALVLVALVLAGCAAPGATVPEPAEPDDAHASSFLPPVDADVACRFSCYEPSLAVDPTGRLFATDGAGSEIAVSQDGGATWTKVAAPPATGVLQARQADVFLQTSPTGRLYFSALLLRTTPTGGVLLEGLQVAWSEDGGATWPVNVQLSPFSDPLARVYAADRQWLGFGEGETVVLTYNQIPSGIWFARSTDGGKSWGGWTRAAALEQRGGGVGQSGPPLVDADGRILVPACATAPSPTFAIFVSADEGRTFQRKDVGPATGCSWFPVLSAAPDGGLVAAWHDGRGTIRVSGSGDGGATWSEPGQWGRGSPTSPWPLALDGGRLALAWFESGELLVARGTPAERGTALVVVDGLKAANTDFAHAALLPDGRLGVVWSEASDKAVLVALEMPAAP